MKVVFREKSFFQLAMVEIVDKQTNSTSQGIRTARKTARRTSQTSKIVSKFSVVCFHRKCIGLAIRDVISSKVIPQGSIDIESITKIPLCFWSLIDDGLHHHLGSLPSDFPAQNTSGFSIYKCNKIDSVFLSPMNVKISSNSAVFTSSGTGALGSCSACSFAQLATL